MLVGVKTHKTYCLITKSKVLKKENGLARNKRKIKNGKGFRIFITFPMYRIHIPYHTFYPVPIRITNETLNHVVFLRHQKFGIERIVIHFLYKWNQKCIFKCREMHDY